MQHFSSEKWADFARNVLEEKEKATMQGHLGTGCVQCSEALAAWVRVRDIAARERVYQPPEATVRTVKGLLAIYGKSRRAAVAALLFDSLMTPGVVGVRSAAGAPRQILYGVDNYRIDLRLEAKTDGDATSLTGQILISGEARPVGQTAVALLIGRRIVATSQTNEFGEFHLACDIASSFRLQFLLPEGRIIRTPMIESSGAAAIHIEVPSDSSGANVRPLGNPGSTRNTA